MAQKGRLGFDNMRVIICLSGASSTPNFSSDADKRMLHSGTSGKEGERQYKQNSFPLPLWVGFVLGFDYGAPCPTRPLRLQLDLTNLTSEFANVFTSKVASRGTSLVVKWLRIHASTAGGTSWLPSWGTKI